MGVPVLIKKNMHQKKRFNIFRVTDKIIFKKMIIYFKNVLNTLD